VESARDWVVYGFRPNCVLNWAEPDLPTDSTWTVHVPPISTVVIHLGSASAPVVQQLLGTPDNPYDLPVQFLDVAVVELVDCV
jgi:hypothetical protein